MTTTPKRRIAALTFCAFALCTGAADAQELAAEATAAAHADGASADQPAPGIRTVEPLRDGGLLEATGPPSSLSSPRLLPRTVGEPAPSVWRDLFAGTWSDTRRFPSRQTLRWVVLGAVVTAGARPADAHVGRSLSTAAQLREVSEPGALIGSTPLQLGMSAAAYGIGRATHSPRMIAVSSDLFRAQLLAQGLTIGVKETVRRKRPEGAGFAFPSGHTTVSFASATVLQQHFGWRVGAPAYALASYVALSRVQMKRHYLSDVAFGAALGIAAGRTITLDRQRRMQLAPMAADGGAGIQFVWTGRR